jgi:pyridoxine/pyridoxamine 5'-phosphate oxidase
MSKTTSGLHNVTKEQIPSTAWRLLQGGRETARDPLHTPVLATSGNFGPSQRTVVLRHVDPSLRILACHTDLRSLKVREACDNQPSSWLFYDRERKLQIRLAGLSSVHSDDHLAELRWSETNPHGKACYNSNHAPGQEVSAPLSAPAPINGTGTEALARARFAVLATRIEFLDWLVLSSKGHRRAQFVWKEGNWSGSWVAP